jgi:hypothetical protein
MCWKPHLVYLARWVKMGKFCLLCFQVRTLMWRPFFSKSPCCIMIVNVQVLGLVEDECTFNTISFMKNRSRIQLNTHLDLCTKFYSQHFFLVLLSFKLIVCLQFHATLSWNDKLISNWFSPYGFRLNQGNNVLSLQFYFIFANGLHWGFGSIHGIFMEYFVVHAIWQIQMKNVVKFIF